jgi:hypothetical protein
MIIEKGGREEGRTETGGVKREAEDRNTNTPIHQYTITPKPATSN